MPVYVALLLSNSKRHSDTCKHELNALHRKSALAFALPRQQQPLLAAVNLDAIQSLCSALEEDLLTSGG